MLLDCSHHVPLGMEDGRILKQQLTASTIWGKAYDANKARLNLKPKGTEGGAWAALYANENQFLQVDFGRNVKVSAVATQGRGAMYRWVKEYKLAYSEEGKTTTLQTYQEDYKDKVKRSN